MLKDPWFSKQIDNIFGLEGKPKGEEKNQIMERNKTKEGEEKPPLVKSTQESSPSNKTTDKQGKATEINYQS
jgi:hypothetical protein